MEAMSLLDDLANWWKRRSAWRQLTAGDALFQALHAAVPQNAGRDWERLGRLAAKAHQEHLEALTEGHKKTDVAPLSQQGRQAEEWRWEVARRMLWCAEQAATRPDCYRTKRGRAYLALADAPKIVRGHESWAWGCIRTLLDAPVHRPALQTPVALWSQEEKSGFLATLVLELLAGGAGEVFHHPADALATQVGQSFAASMRDAWAAACAQGPAAGLNTQDCDGRWRLLRNGRPIAQIAGRSASGSAAQGWWFAGQGKRPDAGVAVLAQVASSPSPAANGSDFALAGVEHVPAKVKAIAAVGRFDTIVVASQANQRQAQEAIAALVKSGRLSPLRRLQVIKPAPTTFQPLTGVRSQLVIEVLDYLHALAERAAELPAYYPGHLRRSEQGENPFDAIRQTVQVVDRSAFERWRAKERERTRAAGLDDHLAYDPTRSWPEAAEKSGLVPSPPQAWDDQASEQFKRAVILGDPGFGKTWLLRYETRRLARQGAQALGQQAISLDDLLLPLFARLSDLNRSDTPLEEALVALAGAGRSPALQEFVRQKLATERCAILLDAWDETPLETPPTGQPIRYEPGYRQRLGQRLAAFARQFPHPRLLLTSRIIGYTGAPLAQAQELELIAFDRPQIEAFVRVWFGREAQATQQFLDMLSHNHPVRGLARIPLMLALMCRAYQEGRLTFPTRRVDLYERCLRGLLQDWKEQKALPASPAYADAMLELLQFTGYALFADGQEQFDETLLRKTMTPWLEGRQPWHELYGQSPDDLIKELKRDGILVSAGEHPSAILLFLHRTFLEYLAARWLAGRANEKGWQTIAGLVSCKTWLPDWQQVIILLAGQLADPQPLLGLLADPRPSELNPHGDDLFRHRLALAALCLPEVKPATRRSLSLLVDQIASDAFSLWWEYSSTNAHNAVPHLIRALPALVHVNARVRGQGGSKAPLMSHLISLLQDRDTGTRAAAAKALGHIGSLAAMPEALAHLAECLRDEDTWVRWQAVESIGTLENAAADPGILSILADRLRDANPGVRQAAAWATGTAESAAATPEILATLTERLRGDEEQDARLAMVWTLGNMGSAAETPDVLACLSRLQADGDADVRQAAAWAMSNITGDAAQPTAPTTAAQATGNEGTPTPSSKMLTDLTGRLEDENPQVRRATAWTIASTETPEATLEILKLLAERQRRENPHVQSIAETPELLDGVIRMIRDEDRYVRRAAVHLLAVIGSAAATDDLRAHLADMVFDEDRWTRRAAAQAIAHIGAGGMRLSVVQYLAHMMQGKNGYLRAQAAWVAGILGGPAATPAILDSLAKCLHNEDWWARRTAAEALGHMGGKAATPEVLAGLAERLDDDHWMVRLAAVQAVGEIGSAAVSAEIVDHLIAALRHKDRLLQKMALWALGSMGEAAAAPAVLAALGDALCDEDWWVQRAAAWTLGRMDCVEAACEHLGAAASSGLVAWLRDETEDQPNEAVMPQVGVNQLRHQTQDTQRAGLMAGNIAPSLEAPDFQDYLRGSKSPLHEVFALLAHRLQSGDWVTRLMASGVVAHLMAQEGLRIFAGPKGAWQAQTVAALSGEATSVAAPGAPMTSLR